MMMTQVACFMFIQFIYGIYICFECNVNVKYYIVWRWSHSHIIMWLWCWVVYFIASMRVCVLAHQQQLGWLFLSSWLNAHMWCASALVCIGFVGESPQKHVLNKNRDCEPHCSMQLDDTIDRAQLSSLYILTVALLIMVSALKCT